MSSYPSVDPPPSQPHPVYSTAGASPPAYTSTGQPPPVNWPATNGTSPSPGPAASQAIYHISGEDHSSPVNPQYTPSPVPPYDQSSTVPSTPGVTQPLPYVVGQPVATDAGEKPQGGGPTYAQMWQDNQGGGAGPYRPQYVQPPWGGSPQGWGGAHVIGVQEVQGGLPQMQQEQVYDDDMSWKLSCARISCILSIFFPIIGCIAFCVNMDAQQGSQRYKWARYCLYTAFGFTILWSVISGASRS
ncbi:unnamed protein product [Vitrella brassicaformis CCMP3155]|uniref:Uncharacterized protein n=1 Tax=Vitrella brassicaformis (strain CCMP3155) TaxID=1169540 RepID=A0A0G4EMI8_VITBC|nr:unnamed protein product [Vitrella brassicaformis CCMP3155]|eukprot:CEL98389.1 unnamed protein product [Vitrella brassicaformis CCMP3155]